MVSNALQTDRVRYGDEFFLSATVGRTKLLVGVECCGRGASKERLENLLGAPDFPFRALRAARQVHDARIVSLECGPDDVSGVDIIGECDGMISETARLGMAIWTADCVPILLAGRDAAAAVHAGWRGAASGIVQEAVTQLNLRYGVAAEDAVAVIGPAVEACHYEVGPEVRQALSRHGVDPALWIRGAAVDLRGFLRGQLRGLGLSDDAIHTLGGCTACTPELASYRRDGAAAGRQVSISGVAVSP